MSKTSNTKQITEIAIDEANGLTHVYMSDPSPKIVKANTTAPTNIPTKSEEAVARWNSFVLTMKSQEK